ELKYRSFFRGYWPGRRRMSLRAVAVGLGAATLSGPEPKCGIGAALWVPAAPQPRSEAELLSEPDTLARGVGLASVKGSTTAVRAAMLKEWRRAGTELNSSPAGVPHWGKGMEVLLAKRTDLHGLPWQLHNRDCIVSEDQYKGMVACRTLHRERAQG